MERTGSESRGRGRSARRSSLWVWCAIWAGVPFAPLRPALAQDASPPKLHEEAVPTERPPQRDTRFEAAAGTTLVTGNARTFAANLGALFVLKRAPSAFVAEASLTYGRAALRDPDTGELGGWEENAENLVGRLRYDYFLTDDDALFVAGLARRDPFAGLDLRASGQAGYLRNIFNREETHRLWAEVGYDFTYDNYEPDPLRDEMGEVLSGSDEIHSARVFLGYVNRLTPTLELQTGGEAFVNVEEPKDTRVQWESKLRSTLTSVLKLSIDFTLRYDHVPPPGAEKLDTLTTVNLVAGMDFDPEPPEEGESS